VVLRFPIQYFGYGIQYTPKTKYLNLLRRLCRLA